MIAYLIEYSKVILYIAFLVFIMIQFVLAGHRKQTNEQIFYGVVLLLIANF